MCDPATLAVMTTAATSAASAVEGAISSIGAISASTAGSLATGLSIAGTATQFAAGMQQAKTTNQQAQQANIDANVNAGWQGLREGQQYAYNVKSLNEQGYDETIKAKQNIGAGIASAGASGVGGLTLGALVSDAEQQGATSQNRINAKKEDLKTSYRSNIQGIDAAARSTINSNPYDPGPSVLGLAIKSAGTWAEYKAGK
jgi:hypothetical protein